MRRLLRSVIGVLLLLMVTGCLEKEKPDEVFQAYLSQWQSMNYKEMYNHLSKDSKKKISQEDFIERYKNIYTGAEVQDLKINRVQDDEEEAKEDSATYEYRLKMDTIAGPIEYKHQVTLLKEEHDEEEGWFVQWNPSLIFPSLEEGDVVAVQTLKATRGEIRDTGGRGLAINDNASVVGIVPELLKEEPEQSMKTLSEQIGMPVEQIKVKLDASWVKPHLFVPITTLPFGQHDLIPFQKIPGVVIQEKKIRTYPYAAATAHLTGYVREVTAEQLEELKDKGYKSGDVVGKTGLEKLFEERLRGRNGAHIFIRHKDGSFKETLVKTDPIDGEDIQLTIDALLQVEMYEQLKGDAGTGVAIDPKSGTVLSLVSSPSYDPNAFVRGLSEDLWKEWNSNPKNPFLARYTNRYAPGSVFKTITAAVGLETGVTNPNEVKHIRGLRWTKDASWGDYYVTRVHDKLSVNLRDAFVHSDNIYFAQEALEIGTDTFLKKAKVFGFGEQIPFTIPVEPSTLSNNGITSEIQLVDTSYGQGEVMMSPLHLAILYTPFLNEGDLLAPYLLKDEESPSIWKKSIVKPEVVEIIKQSLMDVVQDPNGTAHGAFLRDKEIGGKSGTAELKVSKDDDRGTENGWFVGFNTRDPQLLLAMMVEDVKKRGGSGYVVNKAKHIFQSLP
ncbi:penicillin-binding transpeptidase domain-containing protein [Radiobacillus deserti]|uniref:penicillin-binding transpeptidase domain-containing protein n=1 Tax=Radiobacillus deserti TaxID=2594883 RepID=UPI0013158D4D|nr:penicillin-binding transpeptidase domain-containing protein [Radiobacillus deserti]